MPDAYGPAEYLERIGYSVADVRSAWSKRYQSIKRAKVARDICVIHAETIRATETMRPNTANQPRDAAPTKMEPR